MEARLEETLNQEQQVEEVQPVEEKTNWGRFFLDVVETVVLAVILFIGINAVSARVRVDGFSMRPTLDDGEFLLVNKLSYKWNDFSRGDIVVFHFPLNPEEELIKRVIGLPGDHVVVRNSRVYVNDELVQEGYIEQAPLYTGEWFVTQDHLFVLGDNRNNSNDSKDWGMLPMENVVGRAVLIYWPPPVWKVIDHPDLLPAQ
ncbi:MAG TPA: signal peptidase I [Anaerolineales bacterium]|nr:signal peptidase I [Anaerolineales bacterium]